MPGRRRAASGSDGPSPSRRPPTIWCATETSGGAALAFSQPSKVTGRWHRRSQSGIAAMSPSAAPAKITVDVATLARSPCASRRSRPRRQPFTRAGFDDMTEASVTAPPNCSMTDRSRSHSQTTTATRLSRAAIRPHGNVADLPSKAPRGRDRRPSRTQGRIRIQLLKEPSIPSPVPVRCLSHTRLLSRPSKRP